MWTKLLWMEFPKALKPTKFGTQRASAMISKRYQAVLKKQFRINDIPWIFQPHKSIYENNPRNRKPKGTKLERNRPLRIAKIQKNLELNEQAELDYRLNRLNNKKLTGLDLYIQKAIPSFLSNRADKAGQKESLVKIKSTTSGFKKNAK
ncbi:hypothetical protein PPERSA_12173 [Pseudocohnilembus persalinus]|uniref:MRPL25 domain-containing protein n=1 Tax=Pseudocohnilembus persalinus TaxID=266149 RepID=A0A0V0R8S2_PSEPJ|nr:hypothetical protein PPERSA_12173 [Pseudocohnilembus persalinus]|eukprot:KRX10891.1 hypothetical protein PPERSA_12173 [Pseudocohnilembus persalinus]